MLQNFSLSCSVGSSFSCKKIPTLLPNLADQDRSESGSALDPHHFGKPYSDTGTHLSEKPDPDPHKSEKTDQDQHQSENPRALKAHNGATDVYFKVKTREL